MFLKPELLDVRGSGCSEVLIRLAALARRTQSVDRPVLVWTDDLGAPSELPAWCRMTGHHYRGPIPGRPDHFALTLHPKEIIS